VDVLERPIGYWLKHLDRLIDQALDRCLAEDGLSRRHWQVMNVLARGPVGERDLAEALQPFWGDGAVTLGDVTGELARREWLVADVAGGFALSPAGADAHARVAERVRAQRRRSADGLTAAEYEAAVRVLRRMAENLGG
jgi:hypothetical protein